MTQRIPRVALLIDSSRSFGRDLLQGVIRYQRENRPWRIHFRQHGLLELQPSWLANWKGDGVLVQVQNERMAHAVIKSKLAAVDLTYNVESHGIPRITLDNRCGVRLATEHLLERNFCRFGFIGSERGVNSRLDERCDLFVETLFEAGHTCSVFSSKRIRVGVTGWEAEHQKIAEWIKSLPKPVGIMACHDQRAYEVLNACSLAGVLVPDEVAVIGAGNDKVLCRLCDPTLSSVEPGAERLGREAATLLDCLMAGEEPPSQPIILPPLYVVTRQSTDVLAIDDPDVVNALRFIRNHACDGISVEDVVSQVGSASRRVLDTRCRKLIGRTLHGEIRRVQVQRIKQLLAETELSLVSLGASKPATHGRFKPSQ